ncbi:response regulator transcription factor [Kineothrix sp. MB12-C1]|uniref:response regulator transcription factor n=1 Tax=Kineothrix sp. MB12-C1 TaxID=3070215 RepID=UPI0027D27900|nr:helix-turn-helix domain-containing protein [Kineothrix sp. MB12-C1]WMC91326.1 response regulator [Kineothrix sp. MB12-C1]
MYKIMLADDEGIVIDSLKFIIEKEFGDLCLVEYAKTGRNVIELAEHLRPDIAIMDIHMPGISGIEAMKEIRKTNSNVIFIIMSAYDKFDYAKEAINLGVMEYLTKPMDREKITKALKKAMNQVDDERAKRSNDLIIKEKLETVVPIIENGLIHNILLQEYFKEDAENYKGLLGIEESYGYMIGVVCGEEQRGNYMTNAVGAGMRLQNHYKEVRELIKESFPGVVGGLMANKIPVLVPYAASKMDYNERIELIEKARELVRKMRKRMDISFRIGIGSVKSFHNQQESYNESLNALINSTGSVAHAEDLPLVCEYEANYPIDLEKKLFEAILKGDVNSTLSYSSVYFDWMKDTYPDSIMDIRLKTIEFVLWAEHLAYENGGMTYEFCARTDYLPKVMELQGMENLKEWFASKMTEACRNIATKREEKSSSVVEKAKEYISSRYNKDMSLDDVSREVNISPYYFSKIFKEETGTNFIEYLTNVRIEKAKELLKDTEYTMKEICSMVGYQDPNYFSRSFKKNVGVTPTEYKEGSI